MANKTNNYKFPKPEADDFYDISEYNKAMDILDDSLTEMDQKKLDKNGDASEAVTEFEQEILRENIESGETLSSTFGKIKKWFTEMKDVAFSGHAKDVTTDAAYRFVSDAEKISWNGKVGASGGDISETVINKLEIIEEKYPVPTAGECTKKFLGKVKKYIETTKPLDSDTTLYVDTIGDDTTGNGTALKPFKTLQYAINTLPKDLGGYGVNILIADGTYNEVVNVYCFYNGALDIKSLNSPDALNNLCKIRQIIVRYCTARMQVFGLFFTESKQESAFLARDSRYVRVMFCQTSGSIPYGFDFIYCENVITHGCLAKNAQYCARAYISNLLSIEWSSASLATRFGIAVDGGTIRKAGLQPSGSLGEVLQLTGGVVTNQNGTQISGVISSGLSCTWGMLQGGYVRHGNLYGPAIITIQLRVILTSALLPETDYVINGFPGTAVDIGISCNAQANMSNSYLNTVGGIVIKLIPGRTMYSGNVLVFNCTYLTN